MSWLYLPWKYSLNRGFKPKLLQIPYIKSCHEVLQNSPQSRNRCPVFTGTTWGSLRSRRYLMKLILQRGVTTYSFCFQPRKGRQPRGWSSQCLEVMASSQLLLVGVFMPEALTRKWHVNQKHLSLLCAGGVCADNHVKL